VKASGKQTKPTKVVKVKGEVGKGAEGYERVIEK
jgi:hypothetical protein